MYYVEIYDDSDPANFRQAWMQTDGNVSGDLVDLSTPGAAGTASGTAVVHGRVVATAACSDGCSPALDFSKLTARLVISGDWIPTIIDVKVDSTGTFTFPFVASGTYQVIGGYAGSEFENTPHGTSSFTVVEAGTASPFVPVRQIRHDLRQGSEPAELEPTVFGLYWDLLKRTPSDADVRSWMNGYDAQQGSSVPAEAWMAGAFVQSDEYRLRRIDDAYSAILERNADTKGQATWLTDMKNGWIQTDDIAKSTG